MFHNKAVLPCHGLFLPEAYRNKNTKYNIMPMKWVVPAKIWSCDIKTHSLQPFILLSELTYFTFEQQKVSIYMHIHMHAFPPLCNRNVSQTLPNKIVGGGLFPGPFLVGFNSRLWLSHAKTQIFFFRSVPLVLWPSFMKTRVDLGTRKNIQQIPCVISQSGCTCPIRAYGHPHLDKSGGWKWS